MKVGIIIWSLQLQGNVMVNIVVSAKTGRHLGTQGEKVGGLFFVSGSPWEI